MRNLERELAIATGLARRAGELLRTRQHGGFDFGFKAGGELVTTADLESDQLIRKGLAAAFRHDYICSEETPDSPKRLDFDRVWMVDPLDGTSNFVVGGRDYSVSIGLAVSGDPVLGVVYNPADDLLFAGAHAMGVCRNGSPVRTSDKDSLEGARVGVSRKEFEPRLRGVGSPFQMIPIASMAYKLARVAAGLEDAVFSLKQRKEWGTCAGVALVLAGGGEACLLNGNPMRFNVPGLRQPDGFAAGNPKLLPSLVEYVRALRMPADRAGSKSIKEDFGKTRSATEGSE